MNWKTLIKYFRHAAACSKAMPRDRRTTVVDIAERRVAVRAYGDGVWYEGVMTPTSPDWRFNNPRLVELESDRLIRIGRKLANGTKDDAIAGPTPTTGLVPPQPDDSVVSIGVPIPVIERALVAAGKDIGIQFKCGSVMSTDRHRASVETVDADVSFEVVVPTRLAELASSAAVGIVRVETWADWCRIVSGDESWTMWIGHGHQLYPPITQVMQPETTGWVVVATNALERPVAAVGALTSELYRDHEKKAPGHVVIRTVGDRIGIGVAELGIGVELPVPAVSYDGVGEVVLGHDYIADALAACPESNVKIAFPKSQFSPAVLSAGSWQHVIMQMYPEWRRR